LPDPFALPFFADLRVNFTKKKISPYNVVKLGYSTHLSHAMKGGVYFAPAIGIRFGIYKKLALNFSVGYTLHQAVLEKSQLSCCSSLNEKIVMNSMTIKLGFEF